MHCSTDVNFLAALLFNSLTLGPLSLSSFATVPRTADAPSVIIQHLPAEGTITSAFGIRRHPVWGGTRHHDGIDIANGPASIIYASAAGRVRRIGRDGGYGLIVEIDHGSGWRSRYAHLAATAVRVGDFVFAGAMIGRMGRSGLSTGTHLHYELHHQGHPIDPMPHLVLASKS